MNPPKTSLRFRRSRANYLVTRFAFGIPLNVDQTTSRLWRFTARGRIGAALFIISLAAVPLVSAFGDTLATNYPIDGPCALAIDKQGHLFVAGLYDDIVRRVDLGRGTITIIAGNGKECCYKNGEKANKVSLRGVLSLAVNSYGDLFIADNTQVRKVDATTGIISTVAGSGKSENTLEGALALSAGFQRIAGLAFDGHGDLFMADDIQSKVFRIDATTDRVFCAAGSGRSGFSGDGGPATDASFYFPDSLAFDKNGSLLIADYENCRIRRVDHQTGIIDSAVLTDTLEKCSEAAKNNWPLSTPSDLVADSSGNIFFVETAINFVTRVAPNSQTPEFIAGNGRIGFSGDGGPASKASVHAPSGLAIDANGNLFFSDLVNNRVRRIDARTKIITTIVGNGLPHVMHPEM